jgi:hypothetical protein
MKNKTDVSVSDIKAVLEFINVVGKIDAFGDGIGAKVSKAEIATARFAAVKATNNIIVRFAGGR